MSDETIDLLTKQLTPCRFPQKVSADTGGSLSQIRLFHRKGITRSYWLVDGKEVTTSFSCEGDIVFSMDELYYGKPGEEFVETLEDVLLYAIPIKTLTELYETNIELANWGRVIHQNGYRELHRKHKERLTLSARERYAKLKERLPDVCSRVNLGYIAAYLGITLPTLSKIRAEE